MDVLLAPIAMVLSLSLIAFLDNFDIDKLITPVFSHFEASHVPFVILCVMLLSGYVVLPFFSILAPRSVVQTFSKFKDQLSLFTTATLIAHTLKVPMEQRVFFGCIFLCAHIAFVIAALLGISTLHKFMSLLGMTASFGLLAWAVVPDFEDHFEHFCGLVSIATKMFEPYFQIKNEL